MLKTFLYKVILRSVFLLIFLAELSFVTAQSYTMTNGSISTCSGTFLDPGGNANYPNNANYIYTICSSNGTHVNAKFNTFKTSANDILYVYDGNSITAPLMGTYTGTLTYPPSLTSSSTCLTFKFVSDASTNNTG
ncbi:MAG: CUB domain-containing protein, partial [Bacteroidota bacterium]